MKIDAILRDTRISGVILIVLLLLVWQLSAMYVVISPTWPTVTRIFEAWTENMFDGTLPKHILATFWRQMLGYGLAIVLGVGLGLVMGYFRPLYNLFEPLVEVLRPIPGPAYLPILVLFVTHDLDEALYLAQRVILLSASPGTIAETVEVPLAYPRRQIETRSEETYLHLREHLYRNMVKQVMAGREIAP